MIFNTVLRDENITRSTTCHNIYQNSYKSIISMSRKQCLSIETASSKNQEKPLGPGYGSPVTTMKLTRAAQRIYSVTYQCLWPSSVTSNTVTNSPLSICLRGLVMKSLEPNLVHRNEARGNKSAKFVMKTNTPARAFPRQIFVLIQGQFTL